MVSVKKVVIYTLKCSHCENVLNVNEIKDGHNGWKIISNRHPIDEKNISEIKCPVCLQKEYDILYNSKKMTDRIKTRYYNEHHGFYDDLVKELGIENHPKVKKFISLVIDHDEGWNNNYYFAEELVELMRN